MLYINTMKWRSLESSLTSGCNICFYIQFGIKEQITYLALTLFLTQPLILTLTTTITTTITVRQTLKPIIDIVFFWVENRVADGLAGRSVRRLISQWLLVHHAFSV